MEDFELYAKKQFIRNGTCLMNRWLDSEPKVLNVERVHKSEMGPPFLYPSNHQSLLDYFVPSWVLLNESLPYPRSIIGKNLDNWFVKSLMVDFKKWGGIPVERRNPSVSSMRKYFSEVKNAFREGYSIYVFPEAGRNRNPEKGLREFRHEFFRIVLNSQSDMDDEIKIVPMAIKYTKIPEKKYWEKIDAKGFGSLSYFGWDMIAYLTHVRSRDKGEAIVNFGSPVRLKELGLKGSHEEKSKQVSDFVKSEISGLIREIG